MTTTCRHCTSTDTLAFLDLGYAPPSNAYLSPEALNAPEMTFPLRLFVCRDCRLVQTEDFSDAGHLFDADYAYFSSTSAGWLAHARRYCETMRDRFNLGQNSHVTEVAANDGYLLKNFVEWGIPCLGVEPTHSTAAAARKLGIEVAEVFLGAETAAALPKSDLVAGNNVFAHVPDINDFSAGLAILLKPQGVLTLEFPHLMNLVGQAQFDTVYHEHYSYISLLSAERVLAGAGLRCFDVEALPTHGGSLRLFACHAAAAHTETDAIVAMRAQEAAQGMKTDPYYEGFQQVAERVKNDFLRFLLQAKSEGKTVAGYGAAAKGNTLMNFAGIGPDLMPFVCDAAPSKQGKLLPGSHIPVMTPDALRAHRPDYIVILPWNIAPEVRAQLSDLAEQGTQFVTAVPELTIT